MSCDYDLYITQATSCTTVPLPTSFVPSCFPRSTLVRACDKCLAHCALAHGPGDRVLYRSENLCSLVSGVDRLAMSCIWMLDENMQVTDTWFGRTIIHSNHKLHYAQVGGRRCTFKVPDLTQGLGS